MPDLILPPDLTPNNTVNSGIQSETTQQPTSQSQPQGLKLPADLTPGTPDHTSRLEALSKGAQLGIDAFSSSIDKLVSKTFHTEVTPQQLQDQYVKESQDYENNPSVKAHPFIAGLGRVGAGVVATAPAAILTGGVGGLLEGGAEAAGLGAGAQTAARVVGNLGSNMIQGGATAGLMNDAQQGTDAWNPQAARTGALLGAGATALGAAMPNVSQQLTDMQASSKALKAIGAQSSRFASDVEGGVSKWFANNVLSQFPSILGTASARTSQGKQVGEDLLNYFGALSDSTLENSKTKIGNIIADHANKLDGMVTDAANNLADTTKAAGITQIPRTTSSELITSLKTDYSKDIGTGLTKQLTTLPEQLGPDAHLDLSRDIWKQYQVLAKKVDAGTATTDQADAASTLRNTYFALRNDFAGAVAGTKAEPAFNSFNQITSGVKTLFDPQYNKQLVNAIDDMNSSRRDLGKFIDWMTNPKTSSRDVQTMTGFLGTEGTNEVSKYNITQMLQKSLDRTDGQNPSLNLNKFLQNYNSIPSTSQKYIHQDTMDSLSGLMQVANDYVQAGNRSYSGLKDLAVGGVAGAAALHNPALTAGVTATLPVLSYLSRHAPIKASLNALNKASATLGGNPELSQYILQKSKDQLLRAGIIMNQNPDGSLKIDTRSQQ